MTSRPRGQSDRQGEAVSISAIVVTHQSARHLPDLLPRLAAAVEEVVVVDNRSTDGSPEQAAALAPDATIIRLPDNRGFAAGVNCGVLATSGTHVLLLNPDARLEADTVAQLRAAARHHRDDVLGPVVYDAAGVLQRTRSGTPSLWTVLGEQVLIPESSRPGSWPASLWPRWQRYDAVVEGPLLSGVCLLIPRHVWDATGPMDEGFFLYWEEMDWQMRARAAGTRSLLVPAARITHARSTGSDLSPVRKAEHMARANHRYLRRWLPGVRGSCAVALIATGQLLRWLAWQLPGLRHRDRATQRRKVALAALRALVGPLTPGPA